MKSFATLRRALLVGVTGCALFYSPASFAQSRPQVHFSIPAGTLKQSLQAFAEQSNMPVIYSDDLVISRRSRGYVGAVTPADALAQILAGTGLGFKASADGTLMIVAQELARLDRISAVDQQAPEAPIPDSTVAATTAAATPVPVEEIVVTASRISRSGFTAPTPTTVLSTAEIERKAPASIADVLNELPAFRPSATPTAAVQSINNSGQNLADLRGLGPVRTLILVDGRRRVPTTSNGLVDLNQIPAILVERAEVVTGGASAAWGSDAVAGVINFILRDRLQGVRADVQYGESRYGDDINYKVALAAGTKVGEYGHLLIGGEYAKGKGVGDIYQRPAGREERNFVVNPNFATNGQPANIYATNVHQATQSKGGLITSGPLRGTAFGAGGVPYQFNYGQVYSSLMIGGDGYGETIPVGLARKLPVERIATLARFNYDLTSSINAFIQGSYSRSETSTTGVGHRDAGTLVIQPDNAFIPASIKSRVTSSFNMGRYDSDLGLTPYHSTNSAWEAVAGLKGDLGGSWKWDVYGQYGQNKLRAYVYGNRIETNWTRAIDAVVNPANGQIVCRSTLTAPGNGCVPFNVFGSGSATADATRYVLGDQKYDQITKQSVASANISGEPFSTWAGAVSVAVGFEYRRVSVNGISDANSQARAYRFGNPQPLYASLNVKEFYGETVVPLLRDLSWAKLIEFNGAVRRTNYSTSGSVTTWKGGVNYQVNDQIRLRGTYSRDIRAPNLVELFTSSSTTNNVLFNPFNGDNLQTTFETRGNPDLKAEKAKTITGGVVLQPSFIPRLRLAFDYYQIKVAGQIASPTPQSVVNRCFAGAAEFCPLIIRGDPANPGRITRVITPQLNVAKFKTRGFDIELAYSQPLSEIADALPGTLSARVLATRVIELATTDTVGTIDRAGEVGGAGTPKWLVEPSLTYAWDRGSFTTTFRYIAKGTVDNTTVPGTITSRNINTVPAKIYTNLAASYDIISTDTKKVQAFVAVDNLFNVQEPFPVGAVLATGGVYYDIVGTTFRGGVRVSF